MFKKNQYSPDDLLKLGWSEENVMELELYIVFQDRLDPLNVSVFNTQVNSISRCNDHIDQSSVNVRLVCLNVCGLGSKLKFGIINEYIKNFDIISLCETKTDTVDTDSFPGYKVFTLEHKKQVDLLVLTDMVVYKVLVYWLKTHYLHVLKQ